MELAFLIAVLQLIAAVLGLAKETVEFLSEVVGQRRKDKR